MLCASPKAVLVEISGEFRYTGHAYQHCGDKGGSTVEKSQVVTFR